MIQLQFVLIVYSANMTHLKSNMKPNNVWIVVYMFILFQQVLFSFPLFATSFCWGDGGGCPVSGVCHCDLPRWSATVNPSGCNRHIQRSLQCHNALGSVAASWGSGGEKDIIFGGGCCIRESSGLFKTLQRRALTLKLLKLGTMETSTVESPAGLKNIIY